MPAFFRIDRIFSHGFDAFWSGISFAKVLLKYEVGRRPEYELVNCIHILQRTTCSYIKSVLKGRGMEAQQIRALLVEDNDSDAWLVPEMLQEVEGEIRLERTDRLSAVLDFVKREKIDIVLLDLWLPDSRGLDTFKNSGSPISILP